MQREIYIFMGPPGAGKGTLSARCVNNLGWHQLSTGALCREHIEQQTEIGKQIDFIIKSGKLISDSLIISMVEQWLFSHPTDKALILDGFPRTYAQAEALQVLLNKEDPGRYAVKLVHINIDDEIVVHRLLSRAICSNASCQAIFALEHPHVTIESMKCEKCSHMLTRRADDNESTIRNRLAIYHQHASELLNFFVAQHYKIINVRGENSMDDVFHHFKKQIGLTTV